MESNTDNTNQEGPVKKSPFEDMSKEELVTKCKGLLIIAQKAKQSKIDMQADAENVKKQLEKCEKEKAATLQNVQTLQELVDSLTEQKLNYITQVDSIQSKLKLLTEKCNAYEEEIKNFQSEVTAKDKAIAELAQKLTNSDNETVSLKRQKNRLLEENEQLITQLTELESRITEFNAIGLQQREQLRLLEETVQTDDTYKAKVDELNNTIQELERKLCSEHNKNREVDSTYYKNKIKEITDLYESEKVKKEKASIKLRSYKDKILKCVACINQLKNSRFILTKTVKEYSENIPKWQNDIIKASKVLDEQITTLNIENSNLKLKNDELEKQLNDILSSQKSMVSDNSYETLKIEKDAMAEQLKEVCGQYETLKNNNLEVKTELSNLQIKYKDLSETQLPSHINKANSLNTQLVELTDTNNKQTLQINELSALVKDLRVKNKNLEDKFRENAENKDPLLHLQIKALESEKDILVKEKLNARDTICELENQNKVLSEKTSKMKSEIQTLKASIKNITEEKLNLLAKAKQENDPKVANLKINLKTLQEENDLLKKEYENIQDLNALLKEEVETLKLSLERPADDNENAAELNVSLQADIVKLETKLAAYKQENASLLSEIKESRPKIKQFDEIVAENEETKSKLQSYKTENTELLNEMKEINQVLKERGEAISKLQKAVGEMERLIETLETSRDDINQEKLDLQRQVDALQDDLKSVKGIIVNNSEVVEQLTLARDKALKELVDKDNAIAVLTDEIEKMKQQQSSDIPNEDMSTSTISRAEEHSRMKELDETFEDKYTKLRIFALKLKKKLNETTSLLQQVENDKAKLEKIISETNISGNKQEIPSSHGNGKADGDHHKDNFLMEDLETKVKSLTVAADDSEKLAAEINTIKGELAFKQQQLNSEIEAHKATKESLQKAQRDAKKKNVLSLEIEDYEKSVKELTSKIEENKKKMIQMESTIDTQEGTITATRTQIKLLEEQIKVEETQNRLVKEELQRILEESKEKDNVIQTKNAIITKLEQELEDQKRKEEESVLEMTVLVTEKEKIIFSLGEEKFEINNKLKKLEFRCAELTEQLKISNIELADLKTEYTSYKVRAQAVLRQNQNVDHSQEEQLKEETAALRTQIESLTAKLTTALEQCSEQSSEAETARRRAADAAGEAARAAARTARLQADLTRLSQQAEAERAQHKLQVSTLTQCYKSQISDLERKLQTETESLRKQLAAAHETARNQSASAAETNANQYMMPIPKDEGSDGEMDINVSMIPREEGEGSESAPSPPLSKSFLTGGGSRSPVPLERLLEEGVPEDEALDAASLALTPDQEINELRRKLTAQQLRVKHVTALLSESERECARMAQLSELLKAELRRVRGAGAHAHNAEYMKNVTLKFLTLPSGDERCRLVPVLQKILTLTPEETNKIHAVAKGLDPNPSKGWGSYLPWPGGK